MRLSISKYWRKRKIHYQLILGYCDKCDTYHFPPRPRCPYCGSKEIKNKESKGLGTLINYTQSYVRLEYLEHELPLIIGLIKLDEGPIIKGVITDVDPSDIREGLRVEAVLRRLETDGESGLILYGIKFKPLK